VPMFFSLLARKPRPQHTHGPDPGPGQGAGGVAPLGEGRS